MGHEHSTDLHGLHKGGHRGHEVHVFGGQPTQMLLQERKEQKVWWAVTCGSQTTSHISQHFGDQVLSMHARQKAKYAPRIAFEAAKHRRKQQEALFGAELQSF